MFLPLLLIAFAAVEDPPAGVTAAPRTSIEERNLALLLNVHRIYVDRLTGGDTAAQMRDLILSSLEGAKRFVITENAERADAILRGSAEDLIFVDSHSSSDSLNVRANISARVKFPRSGSSVPGTTGVLMGASVSARVRAAAAPNASMKR
jgi:hypothetical protein